MSGFHQVRADPSYPECPFCENETVDDRGWCPRCGEFADNHDHLKPVPEIHGTVGEIMDRFSWEIRPDGSARIAA